MKSVFNSPPPNFSIEEATQIVYDYYNIKTLINNLPGDRDQNFICDSGNKKYILKISNPAEDRSILEMQDLAICFIRNKDSELEVPSQIGKIQKVEKPGLNYFVRLLEYLEGRFLKDSVMNENNFEILGFFLGRLSKALDGFSHPASFRKFEWDVRAVASIKSRFDFLGNNKQKKTVIHFLNEFGKNVSANKLRMAVIHNDGNDHNVLVNENGETKGIIDFGDMVYSFQVGEPAVCMAYAGLGIDNSFQAMASVLKGYHSRFPLQNAEIKSAIYLSCVRLCISVTMSAWRMKLFPENEYLGVSQKPAWNLLQKLEKENLRIRSDKFIEYVRS